MQDTMNKELQQKEADYLDACDRAHRAEQERDALRAENERLREELQHIKNHTRPFWQLVPPMNRDGEVADLQNDIIRRAQDGYRRDREADALLQRGDPLPEGILAEIMGEVSRAVRKFPTWPTDPLHAVAVIGEEFGELTKAALGFTYEPHKTSADEVRKEAVQTAAMALRFVLSLDRYEYKPGEQHGQDIRAIMAATWGATRAAGAAKTDDAAI